MEKPNVLAQNFYKFYCDKNFALDVLEKIKKIPYIQNEHNFISSLTLNHMEDFKEIHNWFKECLAEVKKDLKLPFDEIVITETWSNKSVRGEWHHGHIHFNSYLSGIFYLNDSDTGNTWFSVNNFWYNFFLLENNMPKDFKPDDKLIIHKENPEFGKLLLFPSNIYHSVDQHSDQDPRYSIAFNTFPNMRVFNNTYYLHITNTPKFCEVK